MEECAQLVIVAENGYFTFAACLNLRFTRMTRTEGAGGKRGLNSARSTRITRAWDSPITTSTGNTTMNASELSLKTPHILSLILAYVDLHDISSEYARASERNGYLLQCCLVNHLWFPEAARHLWTNTNGGISISVTLSALFAEIDPTRRQLYANFVKEASMAPVDGNHAEMSDASLFGVMFPRLRYVFLICLGGDLYVPRLAGAGVRVLDIDPRFEYYPATYYVSQDEWKEILDAIVIIFPHLEQVTFVDRARVYPGALKRFEECLPLLKDFEHSKVVESDVTDF